MHACEQGWWGVRVWAVPPESQNHARMPPRMKALPTSRQAAPPRASSMQQYAVCRTYRLLQAELYLRRVLQLRDLALGLAPRLDV